MELRQTNRITSLNLLKTIAILLIFNSHSADLYPISALATGGAVGNSVFFIISGYLTKAESGDLFWKSFVNKLKRIYLITWCGVLMRIFIQHEMITSFTNGFTTLIWPTVYWFGGALVMFNLVLFAIEKLNFREHFGRYSLIVLGIYALAYLLIVDRTQWSVETPGLSSAAGFFKCIHYFYIFSLGYYLRKNTQVSNDTRKGLLYVCIAALSFIIQVGFKFVMVKIPFFFQFQFISQICNITFALFLFLGLRCLEQLYCERIPQIIRKGIDWMSTLSYEMFVAQFIVIARCTPIPFPVNVAAAFSITLVAAYAIHRLVGCVVKRK